MPKFPLTDLIDAPALHWHNVFSDLLGIESRDASMDDYLTNNTTATVECFPTDLGDGVPRYGWDVYDGAGYGIGGGYTISVEEALERVESFL